MGPVIQQLAAFEAQMKCEKSYEYRSKLEQRICSLPYASALVLPAF
jgi:hypothetical protein